MLLELVPSGTIRLPQPVSLNSSGFTNKRRVQIEWMLRQWPAITALAATAQPGDCFLVPQKGKIRKQETGPAAPD